MSGATAAGSGALRSALRELELKGSLAGAHLVLATAWMASFGVSKAIEGILFGALVGVTLLRARDLMPVWRAAWHSSRALVVFTALLAWVWCSGAWSPDGAPAESVPSRFLLVPWLLVPLGRSCFVLIWAYLGGQMFQATWIISEGLTAAELRQGAPLGSSGDPYQWRYLLAFAAPLAVAIATAARRAIPTSMALLAAGTTLWAGIFLGSRTPLFGALAGIATVLALALMAGGRARKVGVLVLILGGALIAGTAATRGPVWVRLAIAGEAVAPLEIDRALSRRPTLWRLALAGMPDAPILGHGRGSFKTALVASAQDPDSDVRALWGPSGPNLQGAHCAFLDLAYEQGLVGLGLMVGLMWVTVRQVLRGPTAIRACVLGALATWGTAALSESSLNTRAGTVTLALLVWLSTVACGAVDGEQ